MSSLQHPHVPFDADSGDDLEFMPPRLEPSSPGLQFYNGFAPGDRVLAELIGGGEAIGTVESVRGELHAVRFDNAEFPRRLLLASALRLAPERPVSHLLFA